MTSSNPSQNAKPNATPRANPAARPGANPAANPAANPGANQSPSRPPPRPARTLVKICGITRESDALACCDAGADFVGFVLFEKSPRCVTLARADALARTLKTGITPVLLLVNASDAVLAELSELFPAPSRPCVIQLHGDETPERAQAIAAITGQPIWRAARIPVAPNSQSFDLAEFGAQYDEAQAILLDALSPAYGGAGHPFDWNAFNWSQLKTSVASHLVLGGGLSVANVAQGMRVVRPWAVDVSSGVEASKGIKDPEKISQFIASVRAADAQFTAETQGS
jgi:phosphoribosylanthranilate isomerase